MVFHKQACVLEIQQAGDKKYAWAEKEKIWIAAENQSKATIFSKNGLSARSILLRTHAHGHLSLHNAILFEGRHYFLTDIKPLKRLFFEITAANVQPTSWTLLKGGDTVIDKRVFKKPYELKFVFPAYLTEKYMRYEQNEPMARNEFTWILVTPKMISLNAGDLLKNGKMAYTVQVCHTLDEFKNEYEIFRKEDL